MRIGKITNSTEYQLDEKFQNFPIFKANFGFSNSKNSRNLLIFHIVEFQKFPI